MLFAALVALWLQPLAEAPLTVKTHGLYVPVRVNGQAPILFQFDSAAGWHAVNWRLAEDWGLRLKEHASGAEGAGDGRARAAQVLEARLQVGALEVPFSPAAAINLDGVAARKGTDLNGLLGAPLLRQYVVETDAGAARMRVYDAATWRYAGKGQELPVRVDGMGVPHLKVRFRIGNEWLEGEFKIDSAAGGTALLFSSGFAEKYGLLEKVRASGVRLLADEVGGVGGTSKLWLARVGEVIVGGTAFREPVVGITEAKGGTLARADIAGIIGGGLLHRFNVIYDCPHGRIYLEPSGRLEGPFDEEMSGIRWLTTGERRNEFEVRAVLAGTPAERAGVRVGDRLREVDGRAAGAMDRDDLTHALKGEGRRVLLRFERGGEAVEMTLTLARLL